MNFINIFYSQSLYEFIGTSLAGLVLFLTLFITKNKWINTQTYFITFLTLPAVTYVITKVISNNLALSLGMIGALSIVRFRNPVKSPLELVMYFSLITIGISMGVNYFWSISLLLAILFILIFSFIISNISKKYKFNLFNYSFNTNDSQSFNILEIEASNKIQELESFKELFYYSNFENKFIYKFSFRSRNEANELKHALEKNKDIKSIDLKYNN